MSPTQTFKQEISTLPKSFNINDLNQQKLQYSVSREAQHIYDGKYSRNNRTFEKIVQDTVVGHAAEEYLIQKMKWNTNPSNFNDVISPLGISVEVKVINYKWCNAFRIETDPQGMNLSLWRKKYKDKGHGATSRFVLVYSVQDGQYSLFGGYDLETSTRVGT